MNQLQSGQGDSGHGAVSAVTIDNQMQRLAAGKGLSPDASCARVTGRHPTMLRVNCAWTLLPVTLGQAMAVASSLMLVRFSRHVRAFVVACCLQLVRGVVTLPHGTGQTVRVAAFCTGADAEAAKAAGDGM